MIMAVKLRSSPPNEVAMAPLSQQLFRTPYTDAARASDSVDGINMETARRSVSVRR
jgi:hypothetical protein